MAPLSGSIAWTAPCSHSESGATPAPTYRVRPSNAGVDSEPQPHSGQMHSAASTTDQAGERSSRNCAYSTPSLPVAATNGTPPEVSNSIGEEPHSISYSTEFVGRKK